MNRPSVGSSFGLSKIAAMDNGQNSAKRLGIYTAGIPFT